MIEDTKMKKNFLINSQKMDDDNWTDIECNTDVNFTQEEIIKFLSDFDNFKAVFKTSLELNRKLKAENEKYKKFYTPNIQVAYDAADNGDLNLLKEAMENGCPVNYLTAGFAAKNGHFDCVKYMVEKGVVDLRDDICRSAVLGNQMEILKYLQEKGYKLTMECFEIAYQYGYYEMLKYLGDNKCPYDIYTRFILVCDNEEKFKCLEYCVSMGKVKGDKYDLDMYLKFAKEEYHERIKTLFLEEETYE